MVPPTEPDAGDPTEDGGLTFAGGTTAVLGVSLYGPAPLRSTHIRLESGVSVFYGVNGAGKSAVLRGLESAFGGIRADGSTALLHLRMPDPWPHMYTRERLLEQATPTARGLPSRLLDGFKSGWQWSTLADLADQIFDDWARAVTAFLLRTSEDLADDEATALAEQRLVSIEPIGSATPAWRIHIAAREVPTPGDSTVRRLHEAWNAGAYSALGELAPLALRLGSPGTPEEGHVATSGLLGHPWAPTPIAACGEVGQYVGLPTVITERSGSDSRDRTLRFLNFDERGQTRESLVAATDDGVFGLSAEARTILRDIAETASAVAASILVDAPKLRFFEYPASEWLFGRTAAWQGLDAPSGDWIAVERLSRAERRWCEFAIAFALEQTCIERVGAVALLDEPEAALHVAAERWMLEGLRTLASSHDMPIIAATHSAELLNDPDVALQHVARDASGRTTVTPLASPLRPEIESLGLEPSDLLQLYRVILLVEGQHDKLVLEGLIGDELSRARTLVLPLRGAKSVPHLIEARLLFDFTTAGLIVALDNIRLHNLDEAWAESLALVKEVGIDDGVKHLLDRLSKPTTEERWIREFGIEALKAGSAERVALFGFTLDDIIKYLPADHFVAGADWALLESEHAHHKGKPFKTWLAQDRGADFSDASIEDAVRKTKVSSEMLDLASRCHDMARRRR